MTHPPTALRTTQPDTPSDTVEDILDAALARLAPVLDAAVADEESARARRDELGWIVSTLTSEPELMGGGDADADLIHSQLDLDAVHHDITEAGLAATRAATLRESIAMLVGFLGDASRHFHSKAADSSVLDAGAGAARSTVAAARDEERAWLAREIHDGPAQVMWNAVRTVESVERASHRDPASVGKELRRLRTLLEESATEVRRFMLGLRPATLEAEGLAATIRRHIADHVPDHLRRVYLDLEAGLPPLGPETELTIYRTSQEALHNVVKHAGAAARAWVSLRCLEGTVVLEVRDDGRGFNAAAAPGPAGAGLLGMRERAHVIGAVLEVTSAVGTGTTVRLSVDPQREIPDTILPVLRTQGGHRA